MKKAGTHRNRRTNTKEARRQTCDSHSKIRKRKNTHEKKQELIEIAGQTLRRHLDRRATGTQKSDKDATNEIRTDCTQNYERVTHDNQPQNFSKN